jgi:hypothetical protein
MKGVIARRRLLRLTRHKISDRETGKARLAVKNGWMANTQNVNCSAARGSLHRLVRSHLNPRSGLA